MKTLVLDAIVGSFTSRKDKSMGFRVSTPEMDAREKVALMELEGVNVRMLLEPKDYVAEEKVEVSRELKAKTCSERLRAVLFVKFRQQNDTGNNFDDWYRNEMNRIIDAEKATLQPAPF